MSARCFKKLIEKRKKLVKFWNFCIFTKLIKSQSVLSVFREKETLFEIKINFLYWFLNRYWKKRAFKYCWCRIKAHEQVFLLAFISHIFPYIMMYRQNVTPFNWFLIRITNSLFQAQCSMKAFDFFSRIPPVFTDTIFDISKSIKMARPEYFLLSSFMKVYWLK